MRRTIKTTKLNNSNHTLRMFNSLISKMSDSDKLILTQLIKASLGKIPRVDTIFNVTPITRQAFQVYKKLPSKTKLMIASSIDRKIVNEIMDSIDEQAGTDAYYSLLKTYPEKEATIS